MDTTRFNGRLDHVRIAIRDYKEYTDVQKKTMENMMLTFPFENTVKEHVQTNTQAPIIPVEVSKFPVNKLKKWDVLFAKAGTVIIPHYHIVLKVIGDKVYCLTVTSEKKPFTDLEIKKSRQLKGYICNTLTILPLQEAKKKFVFVYDGSKKEITTIFNSIKEQINSI